MANGYRIFPPGEGPTATQGRGGLSRARGQADRIDPAEVADLKAELAAYKDAFENLQDEPMLTATVVEVRPGDRDGTYQRMLISMGPGNALDINAIDGARVGDRVRLQRNTMQAIDVLRDDAPIGTIVTVQRQTGGAGGLVEAEIMGTLRAFRASGLTVAKGERVILDPGLAFVIGTLGMPPAAYSFAPKMAVSWDDIGGHAEAKAALKEAIELPFSHRELFAAYGKRPVRGVLLSGASGTGKTMLGKAAATAIAKAHGKDHVDEGGFVYVKGPELLNKYIGQSEESIRRMFAAARTHHAEHGYPAVIFLDECDALLGSRDHNVNTTINATTVPQFLAEMDGMDDHATMLILATNRPDMLDPAVVREGRIDRRVHITRPSCDDAKAIFGIHLRDRPISGLVGERAAQIGEVAEMGAGYLFDHERIVRQTDSITVRLRDFASGAMIAGIVEQASTAAMMRDISSDSRAASGISLEDMRWSVDRAQAALANVNLAEVIKERIANQHGANTHV